MSNVETGASLDFAASLIERPSCALCGSSEREVHMSFRDIPVVRCSRCGFLFPSRVLSDDAMRAYYEGTFGSQRHLLGQRVNARTNAVVVEQLLDLRRVKNWLDIGCGYGFLVKWLIE